MKTKKIETPLEACVRLEKILKGHIIYHLSMDTKGKVGLGKWLKRVIRNAKKKKVVRPRYPMISR